MSSSKNNTTYKKTSFLVGNNSEFINEFYADYLSDPKSIPESWRQFFEGLSDEQKLIYNDLQGPSWSPERKNKKTYGRFYSGTNCPSRKKNGACWSHNIRR